jgi:hypothetical protein
MAECEGFSKSSASASSRSSTRSHAFDCSPCVRWLTARHRRRLSGILHHTEEGGRHPRPSATTSRRRCTDVAPFDGVAATTSAEMGSRRGVHGEFGLPTTPTYRDSKARTRREGGGVGYVDDCNATALMSTSSGIRTRPSRPVRLLLLVVLGTVIRRFLNSPSPVSTPHAPYRDSVVRRDPPRTERAGRSPDASRT